MTNHRGVALNRKLNEPDELRKPDEYSVNGIYDDSLRDRAFEPDIDSAAQVQAAIAAALAAYVPDVPSLSDYQRILVVDPGGNGDAVNLSGALALVSGSGASARFGIFIFGRVSESTSCVCPNYVDIFGMPGSQLTFTSGTFQPSGTATGQNPPTYQNIFFQGSGGDIAIAASARAKFSNCKIGGTVTSGNGAVVTFSDCEFSAQFDGDIGTANMTFCDCVFAGVNLLTASTVSMRNCKLTSAVAPTLSIDGATVELWNCYVETTSTTPDVYACEFLSGNLALYNSKMQAIGDATTRGLYIESGATIYGISSTFRGGGTGFAVVGGAALTNVQLLHCVFVGGTTNISCIAGTANGSSIAI